MTNNLPDIYVDSLTKEIVLDHEHNGYQHITRIDRAGTVAMINSLIRGLEELACIRSAL